MNKNNLLTYNTIRLICSIPNAIRRGTGFFILYELPMPDGSMHKINAILTNRHMVKDTTSIKFKLCSLNDDGTPNNQEQVDIEIKDPQKHIIFHPNPKIDLCAIPFEAFKESLESAGKKTYASFYKLKDFSSFADCNLSAINDVIMIGYPEALIDSYNNKPIVRKGITATHPTLKYRGQDEFLIDIACYQGNSGSPVFLYNPIIKNDEEPHIDYDITLLGILYSVLVSKTEGEIDGLPDREAKEHEDDTKDPSPKKVPVAKIDTPVNLGCVINLEQVSILLSEIIKKTVSSI